MDLDDFEYGSRPYTVAKIFDVHALSQDGFRQYIGPDSYAHKFLNKITNKSFNTIYKSESKPKIINSNISNSKTPEEIKEENNETIINIEKDSPKKQDKEVDEESKEQEEKFEKEKKDYGYKTSNAFFSNFLKSKDKNNENNSFNKIFMNRTSGNFYPCKSNLDLLTRRLNFTSSNFKKTENPENNYNRFDKNYLTNIKIITEKDFFKNKNKSENKYERKHDGFHSYNVPKLEKIYVDNTKPMNKLAQKIAKSCVGTKKVSYESANSKAKLREVNEENEKLKSIIHNQMNIHFLRSKNLPNISNVIAQPSLKIKKLDEGGKIKYMGNRYNPYNFQAGRDCESMRRNHNGALFQH